MSSANKTNPVIDQLEQVLETERVPAPYDRWGARLLSHLQKPVQVVVTGLPGSGKSALIELMAAKPVLGHDPSAPVSELVFGTHERVTFEKSDGSVVTEGGVVKTCARPDDVVFARQELPDPALRERCFVEIGLTGEYQKKQATLDAIIERADIVIWCSQSFDEEEQKLWSSVPDHIKDHSFLVLTMADRQLMRGVLSQNIARLEPIVAEEFMGLFPVATLQGIAAQNAAEGRNETLWASSGGAQLMDPLQRQIKQGRMADVDQAVVFLDRLSLRMSRMAMRAQEHEQSAIVENGAAESNQEPLSSAPDAGVLNTAIELIQQKAGSMLQELDSEGELDADRILSGCCDVIASLSNLLDEAEAEDPAMLSLREDVQEGEEMLMLFQLERGEEAALDAATVLLQLRSEFIEKVAV